MDKKVFLKAIKNKANGQFNFSLTQKTLPKKVKNKLSKLKGINIDLEDFEF